VQSKSLVDIIQLECLSQNSCALKITNGHKDGRIWIQSGEVFDAEVPGLTGEPAFQRILGWKTGSFEVLPADPGRVRSIFASYQGLLLNSAQVFDEAASQEVTVATSSEHPVTSGSGSADTAALLTEASQISGVEFVLCIAPGDKSKEDFWGLDNPKPMADFARETLEKFRALGERLQVGELQQVIGSGPQRKVTMARCGKMELCVGFPPAFSTDQLQETLNSILAKWDS
jgi:hypothetical protein